MLKPAIIIDLDGTLAEVDHRIKDGKCDHTKIKDDEYNKAVREIISKFQDSHNIVLFTARHTDWRNATKRWCWDNFIIFDALYMKLPHHKGPDYLVKYQMYKEFIEGEYDVLFAIDDNNNVVKMLRDLGITTLQIRNTEY